MEVERDSVAGTGLILQGITIYEIAERQAELYIICKDVAIVVHSGVIICSSRRRLKDAFCLVHA